MNSTPALSADRVRTDVAELLGCAPAELTLDENLFDRGLDSVRMMSLVERWRAEGAAGLEFPDLAERPELGHWTTVLGKAAAS